MTSWRSMTKIAGSGSRSISQRHGSADPDPDPHQNVMESEHWINLQLNAGCWLRIWLSVTWTRTVLRSWWWASLTAWCGTTAGRRQRRRFYIVLAISKFSLHWWLLANIKLILWRSSLNIYLCVVVFYCGACKTRNLSLCRCKKSTKAFESKMRQTSLGINQSCSKRSRVQIILHFINTRIKMHEKCLLLNLIHVSSPKTLTFFLL